LATPGSVHEHEPPPEMVFRFVAMDEGLRFLAIGVDLPDEIVPSGIVFYWIRFLHRYMVEPGCGFKGAEPTHKTVYSNLGGSLRYSRREGFLPQGDWKRPGHEGLRKVGGILYGRRYPMGRELIELLSIRTRMRFQSLEPLFPELARGFIYSEEQLGAVDLELFDWSEQYEAQWDAQVSHMYFFKIAISSTWE